MRYRANMKLVYGLLRHVGIVLVILLAMVSTVYDSFSDLRVRTIRGSRTVAAIRCNSDTFGT